MVCANDLAAIGFISRAGTLGFVVPAQISLTGFDGIQLSGFTSPPLTTVQTSPHDLGAEAARLLLHLIGTGEVLHHEIPPAQLLLQASLRHPDPRPHADAPRPYAERFPLSCARETSQAHDEPNSVPGRETDCGLQHRGLAILPTRCYLQSPKRFGYPEGPHVDDDVARSPRTLATALTCLA